VSPGNIGTLKISFSYSVVSYEMSNDLGNGGAEAVNHKMYVTNN